MSTFHKTLALVLTLISSSAFASNPCAEVEGSTAEYKTGTSELSGCRLKVVAPESLFARLGLKPGDLVHPAGSQVAGKAMSLELKRSALIQSRNGEVNSSAKTDGDSGYVDFESSEQ